MHDNDGPVRGLQGRRRECPTGGAKMKIEFLAHYTARNGISMKDRLIAGLPDYAHAMARVAWLGLRNTLPGAAWLGNGCSGCSRSGRCRHGAPTHFGAGCWTLFSSRDAGRRASRPPHRRALRRYVQWDLRERERACRGARAGAAGYTHTVGAREPPLLRPNFSASGLVAQAKDKAEAVGRRIAVRATRRRDRRPQAVMSAHPARRGEVMASETRPSRFPSRRCCSKSSSRGKSRPVVSQSS